MKLDVSFIEHFDAPPEKVWASLTDAVELSRWLMPNDFRAEIGRRFSLFPDHETPWEGDVSCEVLELDAPRVMVWSWKTSEMKRASRVEFRLSDSRGGTLLRFSHVGGTEVEVAEGLESGWPAMLERFRERLSRR